MKLLPQPDPRHQLMPRRINPQPKPNTLLHSLEIPSTQSLNLKRSQNRRTPNDNLIFCKPPPRALSSAVFITREGYQVITTTKGDEIVFHDNSVLFEAGVFTAD